MKDTNSTEKLFKEINEILEEAKLIQAQTIKKLNSIDSRNQRKKGFIDWIKLEVIATSKLYLRAKKSKKAIEKFNQNFLIASFMKSNRSELFSTNGLN